MLLLFSLSVVSNSLRLPWTTARQASLSIINSQSLLKLVSIESVMPSNHLILCHPLLLLPAIFPRIRSFPMSQFFASGDQSIGVSASALVLQMNIQDFRIDWFDLLAVQGTLKESSPTPQFKIINSLVLSFLYGPTLTSIHDCFSSGLPKGLSGKKQTNKQTNKKHLPVQEMLVQSLGQEDLLK